jgi:16S rRNA (uracil1498-N3)-methyltransferase
MARYDFRMQRLYVEQALAAHETVILEKRQAHYLVNVLRLRPGDKILIFNGRDGEWEASLGGSPKRPELVVSRQTRGQTRPGELHYLFAPLKQARLDYMVQKAVEMGVSHLRPVLTRHTQVTRVNLDRMRANTIEAAEQCGILSLPDILPPAPLDRAITEFDRRGLLVFCDENLEAGDPVAALVAVRKDEQPNPLAVLIGPEGGFADEERRSLLALPNVVRLTLGPRILRADTAAVAALALVGAVLGDWR